MAVTMTQHFTKNTVSASFFCPKCETFTQHRIDHGRKGPCLECIDRANKEHDNRPATPAPAEQKGLFE